jgi:hypothetical protein
MIYTYKDKDYSLFAKSKIKIGDEWKGVVIYKALYDNPDGEYWVRFEEDFLKLFKPKLVEEKDKLKYVKKFIDLLNEHFPEFEAKLKHEEVDTDNGK